MKMEGWLPTHVLRKAVRKGRLGGTDQAMEEVHNQRSGLSAWLVRL